MKKFVYLIIVVTFASTNSYGQAAASIAIGTHAGGIQAAGAQAAASGANVTLGEKLKSQCSANYVFCAMAVLSFVQAGMMIADSLKSKKTASAAECVGAYCNYGGDGSTLPGTTGPVAGTIGTGNLTGDDSVLGRIQNDVNRNLDSLSRQGYNFDASTDSINTPKGNIATASMNSAEGLKSLGMSDADIEKYVDITAAVAKDLKNASKFAGSDGFDSSGGGSKITPGPGYDKDSKNFDMNRYLAGLANKGGNTRGVAGLEKKYGSDQIGVAQDDIFKMIHRRYEAKKTSLNP